MNNSACIQETIVAEADENLEKEVQIQNDIRATCKEVSSEVKLKLI
jgi:hypothetical protein